jgi:endoglucanase
MEPSAARHLRWLREITALPTAPGREGRVEAWVRHWVSDRPDLAIRSDPAGNLAISRRRTDRSRAGRSRLWFTAHMDHPAFVVLARPDDLRIPLEFRGSVQPPYLQGARVDLLDADHRTHPARIIRSIETPGPFPRLEARLARPAPALAPGDIGRWRFPAGSGPGIRRNRIRAHACDDLAGLAAALCALDLARPRPDLACLGVLLTRAEEVGFLGAVAACRNGTIAPADRLLCLEASRSFPDSPIGGGPILRLGDRAGSFDPRLTGRIDDLLRRHGEGAPAFRWQRRWMPGGTCEASAFCAFGFQAACACLPLGNYHNMGDPDTRRPAARALPEVISLKDYLGLIELLTVVADGLDDASLPTLRTRLDRHYHKLAGILSR